MHDITNTSDHTQYIPWRRAEGGRQSWSGPPRGLVKIRRLSEIVVVPGSLSTSSRRMRTNGVGHVTSHLIMPPVYVMCTTVTCSVVAVVASETAALYLGHLLRAELAASCAPRRAPAALSSSPSPPSLPPSLRLFSAHLHQMNRTYM